MELSEIIRGCVQLHLFLSSCSFTLLLPFSVRYVLTEPFIHLSDSSRHGPRNNFKYSHYSAGWVIEHSLCFICQSQFWKSSLFQKVRYESSCSRWSFILHASNWCNKKNLGGVNAIIEKNHISSSALLTNVHLLLKVISLNCHEWGTKANFPPRNNDSMCFIKQSVKPEIKILDNILSSCEIYKILLKGILSHLCTHLFLEKVFPSFRPCYADLLCNQARFLPSPFLNESFSVALFGQPCTLRAAKVSSVICKEN